MKIRIFNRLHVRIWLAVVMAVLLLTLLFGWLWRENADRQRAERGAELPLRELTVRNTRGEIIAKATTRPSGGGKGLEFELAMPDGTQLLAQVPPPARAPRASALLPRWMEANMQRDPGFMLLLWAVLALAVGLGSYPVVRGLTQRLGRLQRGVERWGAGDLRARVEEGGHDEVAFLAQRFNAAADRIEALVQAHKSLLANASHELRSPLSRIRMGVELMAQAPSAALKAELAQSIGELDTLIDEILLSSRLDAARNNLHVDLGSVETVDMIALLAEECARLNVPLECDLGQPPFGADSHHSTHSTHQALHAEQVRRMQLQGVPKLLRRLVRNLLENARRYGGGDVQVALRVVPHSHSTSGLAAFDLPCNIQITVSDRGCGVPTAEHERIFEPFYRSSHASETHGGVGLGLSLVKSIAHSHGGSVVCQSRSGGGACFVVTLAGSCT